MAYPLIPNIDGSNPGPASISSVNPQAVLAAQNMPNVSGVQQGTNGYRLLGLARGVNANQAGDTLIPIINSQSWVPDVAIWCNASISLTTATAALYTGANKTGTALIAAATALSGLTSSLVVGRPTVVAGTKLLAYGLTNGFTNYIYLNIATAQGAAATFDFFLYGIDLT